MSESTPVYTTETPPPAKPTPDPTVGSWRPGPHPCRTRDPEPHLAGEFPMTCHACHLEADS